jgi:hypothetical protein
LTPDEWQTLGVWFASDSPVLHASFSDQQPALGLQQRIRHEDPVLAVETAEPDFLLGFRSYVEGIIDRLTRIDSLVVSDELQQMLDQSVYSPHLTLLFELLWTARFDRAEGRDVASIFARILHDTFDVESILQRCDALLFWLTLFRQNYEGVKLIVLTLVDPVGSDALAQFLRAVGHWAPFGCPLKVIVQT